ncbi:conserved hypothetical protein [Pirellula staleyi DSM 6068]|uniref:Uncharacterized protein n=1 Tax=Pirellula staleyi (strain ATCC 27377 / DSM 6068 / ICPB 4128) TaxID=530564 RepID=D2R280_PIRSD|nr:conserved hypothetical protein [Pirellula staleyi DSM 6068]
MSLTTLISSDYDRSARLKPALLVSLPFALAIVSIFSDISEMHLLIGIVTYFGLTALIAQLGRDEGKRLEPWLFEHWGGKPTTQILRHRNSYLDINTKARYHRTLSSLLPNLPMPSDTTEKNNPTAADAVYESCAQYLRERTRDKRDFPLVHAENVNYGFRRNLWGMKKAGIVISICSLIATLLVTYLRSESGMPYSLPATASLISAWMLVWWLLRIKPSWVRVTAFAYAERLIATCDTFPSSNSTKSSIITSAN